MYVLLLYRVAAKIQKWMSWLYLKIPPFAIVVFLCLQLNPISLLLPLIYLFFFISFFSILPLMATKMTMTFSSSSVLTITKTPIFYTWGSTALCIHASLKFFADKNIDRVPCIFFLLFYFFTAPKSDLVKIFVLLFFFYSAAFSSFFTFFFSSSKLPLSSRRFYFIFIYFALVVSVPAFKLANKAHTFAHEQEKKKKRKN